MEQVLDVSVVWHHFYGVTFVSGETNFVAKATAVTAQNMIGTFDVLPGHANLISVIHDNIVIYTAGQKTDVYFFQRGIIEVSGNQVRFFLEGKNA